MFLVSQLTCLLKCLTGIKTYQVPGERNKYHTITRLVWDIHWWHLGTVHANSKSKARAKQQHGRRLRSSTMNQMVLVHARSIQATRYIVYSSHIVCTYRQ